MTFIGHSPENSIQNFLTSPDMKKRAHVPETTAIPAHRRWVNRLLVPSLVEIFFLAILLAAFARPGGWQALLSDGDTGWHVRTGQMILDSGHVPTRDPFSFSRSGEPWFAWEWLADVLFALVFGRGGIGAVAALAAVVASLALAVLFTWILERGAGLWIALAVTLAAASASTIHYLARPHVCSLLLYTFALFLLDRDRRRQSGLLWTLVPLSAVWANLHGGFVAWLATLALVTLVCAFEGDRYRLRRYSLLAALCFAATFLNPYGWRLHAHIIAYLHSDWILNNVQEFQSPSIRSESLVVFAILLLGGIAMAAFALERFQWFEGLLILVWAFASLRSARHIPFYVIAAAPVIASECAARWRRLAQRSPRGSVWQVTWATAQDLGKSRGWGVWLPATAVAIMFWAPTQADAVFPPVRFPSAAVERNANLLAPSGSMPRVLTSDQWADYLIFRLYPRQRVFFDGRSDFYGPEIGTDYRKLLAAADGWRGVVDRYRFEMALLPRDWPLSTVLDREPHWRRVYEDGVAVLYTRSAQP
jgi:hypothetical protein